MYSVFGAETRDRDAGSYGYFGGVMTPTLLTLFIMISQVGGNEYLLLVSERMLLLRAVFCHPLDNLLPALSKSVCTGLLSIDKINLLLQSAPDYYGSTVVQQLLSMFRSPWTARFERNRFLFSTFFFWKQAYDFWQLLHKKAVPKAVPVIHKWCLKHVLIRFLLLGN